MYETTIMGDNILMNVECISLNSQGEGICKIDGKVIFVPFLLPSEKAKIKIVEEHKNWSRGKITDLLSTSKQRALNYDNEILKLGTHTLAHMNIDFQREFKESQVKEVYSLHSVNSIKFGKDKHYRNKVVLHDGHFYKRKTNEHIKTSLYDLASFDIEKFKGSKGNLIIRKLDTLISGTKKDKNKFTFHTMLGKKFKVNLNSFYQINNEMAEKAYKDIIDSVNSDDIVYDLFSGIGTIGIHISDKANKVYCIEQDISSHTNAVENIKINNISNVEVINENANYFNFERDASVIVVDPPRKGINKHLATRINDSNANKVIYLSCNIQTQIRDINLLTNYKIKIIQPYDFFPNTFHIENLVVLERLK